MKSILKLLLICSTFIVILGLNVKPMVKTSGLFDALVNIQSVSADGPSVVDCFKNWEDTPGLFTGWACKGGTCWLGSCACKPVTLKTLLDQTQRRCPNPPPPA